MEKRCRPLLGTYVEIETDHAGAIESAFAAIEKIHRLMSGHDPDSEISRVNRLGHRRPVAVSQWTHAVIERALSWSRRSLGAFDVVRAGSAALASGELPRFGDQPEPANNADWTVVQLSNGAVLIDGPACLDLGGIAKGFAVDRAIEALVTGGATRGLVNAGGDLRAFGPRPSPVTIVEPRQRRPLAEITIDNAAVATSAGRPDQFGELSFGHLFGESNYRVSVTVRAPNACDADALTKIIWAGSPEAHRLLAETGAEALILHGDGHVEHLIHELHAA
jgi:thiamine biosynthesis lipoprotein